MATRTNLILTDRAATPADHTFSPDGEDANGVHAFSEKNGVPAANKRFTANIRSSGGKYRPSLRLQLPVVQTQTISGIENPVVVRTAFAEVAFTFDQNSTLQERKDCVGFIADALAADQTMINDLIVNLTDIYG